MRALVLLDHGTSARLSSLRVDEDSLAAAVAVWPGLALSASEFAAGLSDEARQSEHLADVYLARAALDADEAAMREVRALVRDLAPKAVRATGVRGYEAGDLEQDLMQLLLVGTLAKQARLRQYEGRGPLGAWLRSCAIRECLMRRRKRSADEPATDVPVALADASDDPELQALKGRDRDAFSEAIASAFASLDSATRTLLRYYYLDRLDQRQIAAIYQVHDATISRRLDKARAEVLEHARTSLLAQGTPTEVWALVRSRLDVSLGALLRTQAPKPE